MPLERDLILCSCLGLWAFHILGFTGAAGEAMESMFIRCSEDVAGKNKGELHEGFRIQKTLVGARAESNKMKCYRDI